MKYHEHLKSLVLLLIAFGSVSNVQAANKALLIGTTAYEVESSNLPGIDLDLVEMKRVARKLGFEKENIRTLKGKDVTLGNLKYQFSSFLNTNVLPSDTVLIYYSGHGVQVPDVSGDESDGADEAISLYDLRSVYKHDTQTVTWDGVLLDDQLAEMLNTLVSDNVIVIVDACHSGTVTRGFTGTESADTKAYGSTSFAVKSLGPPTRATRTLAAGGANLVDREAAGVITLSAAQDNQQALASEKGSLFTLAIAETLESQRLTASPQSLIQEATRILDERLDEDLFYQPNLTGDSTLFDKSIVLTTAEERGEINQGDVLAIARDVSPLQVSLTADLYFQNDPISIDVDVPKDGYLNIVAVASNDEMVVLFPNGFDSDNSVSAGEQELPGTRPFEWSSQEPWGNTMVSVLFSEEPVNLFESSVQKARTGDALSSYVLPSSAGLQGFRDAPGIKAAGVAFLKTCKSPDICD